MIRLKIKTLPNAFFKNVIIPRKNLPNLINHFLEICSLETKDPVLFLSSMSQETHSNWGIMMNQHVSDLGKYIL